MRSFRNVPGCLAASILFLAVPALAGPYQVVKIGDATTAKERVPLASFDHSRWNSLVQKYVDADGLVDYAQWKKSEPDCDLLDEYLRAAGSVDLSTADDQAVTEAFWINIYNALTVKGILREYPTPSILRHVRKRGYNIWEDLLLWVDGKYYSLDTIEHQILRKMGDARIHFAIVCASNGCPRLRNEAYTSSQLDEQLDGNASHFFSRPQSYRRSPDGKTIYVSPIMKWFEEDFGPDDEEQLRRVAPYLPDEADREAVRQGNVKLRYLPYDWGLNEQKDNAPSNTTSNDDPPRPEVSPQPVTPEFTP